MALRIVVLDGVSFGNLEFGELVRMINKRIQADALLLLVAIIWGSAFSAQRVAAANLGFFLFNGLRFLLGAMIVFMFLRGKIGNITKDELLGGLLAGSILIAAATFQHAGLRYTTAGKAGFLTGLYVILIPVLLSLIWRKKIPIITWMASIIAVFGMFLLSLEQGEFSFGFGDLLELLGAVMWAFHVIVIGRFAKKTDGLRLAMLQYGVCGILGVLVGLIFEFDTLHGVPQVMPSILYTGIVSVGIGYTLQVIAQKVAPETDTAIILSLESVFAVVFGWILLGEHLDEWQIIGCLLMLGGMLLTQVASFNHEKNHRTSSVAN